MKRSVHSKGETMDEGQATERNQLPTDTSLGKKTDTIPGASPLPSVVVPKGTTVVLAFDVERLGQSPTVYSTIEVGASVVGPYPLLTELGRYSYSEYRSEAEFAHHYVWEERCRTEFWSKKEQEPILKAIEADTSRVFSVEVSRANMILGLIQFLSSWLEKSKNEGFTLRVVTDNKISDPWTINALIEKYLPNVKTVLPYSPGKDSTYMKIFETGERIAGFLMGAFGPKYEDMTSGFEKTMREEYDWPTFAVQHDHRAANDARHIATTYQCLLATARGEIGRKS